ncbi:conidiophore development protein HymA [Trichinella spiralis]|nr:conidiophore development protein HymA [Trichinella spiralis]
MCSSCSNNLIVSSTVPFRLWVMRFSDFPFYEVSEIALCCGSMLRECIRHEPLARMLLSFEETYRFFTYVEGSTFEVASDAFSTFKDLITKHKALCAEFLEQNYDRFFEAYQHLLNSENYVTRRQSLKLLGELLLDRHNFNVMTRYISNPENLKLMMNLLIERSRSIQFEAFHVFVANPAKPKPIADILIRNRDRLVEFLSKFHSDRTEDEHDLAVPIDEILNARQNIYISVNRPAVNFVQ